MSREPLPLDRQTDRERQRFWAGLAAAFPELPLRYGNTFARWRDVPATELVVSHYLTNRSIGVFVRGQRGIPVPETAAGLFAHAFSLATALEVELGDPRVPFLANHPIAVRDPATWPECYAWLAAAGERYVATIAEIVGGADTI